LDSSRFNAEEDLKYTQRLNLHSYEYKPGVRAGVLAKLLGKDKGDLVYWYETYTEGYVENKKCWKRKRSYSVKPESLNLDEYKDRLVKKLKDTLEITGFNMNDLRLQQSLPQNTTTIP
jgi:DNA polymerase, archaea type